MAATTLPCEVRNSLLTNSEVLVVNQHAASSRQLFTRDNQTAWLADVPGSNAKYLALFNSGATAESIPVTFGALGLPETCTVRDLWSHKDLGPAHSGRTFSIPPHASIFLKLSSSAN